MKSPKAVDQIEIVGADVHYLKNIDVNFPSRGLTLIAGVSGSGKSSLADTLAAEAYRRMRRFLSLPLDWPDDEHPGAFIGPLPACIYTSQRAFRANRRTTVGTASGLLGLVRRLFWRTGGRGAKKTAATFLRRHPKHMSNGCNAITRVA